MWPIGYFRSVFQYKNGTPRQPSLCSMARGSLTVEKAVFNNPEHALEGLEQFSHAWYTSYLLLYNVVCFSYLLFYLCEARLLWRKPSSTILNTRWKAWISFLMLGTLRTCCYRILCVYSLFFHLHVFMYKKSWGAEWRKGNNNCTKSRSAATLAYTEVTSLDLLGLQQDCKAFEDNLVERENWCTCMCVSCMSVCFSVWVHCEFVYLNT